MPSPASTSLSSTVCASPPSWTTPSTTCAPTRKWRGASPMSGPGRCRRSAPSTDSPTGSKSTRRTETRTIAFDWGLTGESYCHNFLELGLDPARVDALVLSHGHQDHFGGLAGFLAHVSTLDEARPRLSRRRRPLPASLQRAWRRARVHRPAPARRARAPGPRRARRDGADRAGRRRAAVGRDARDGALRGHPAVPPRRARRPGRAGHVHRRADARGPRAGPRPRRRHVVLAPRHRGHLPSRRRASPASTRSTPSSAAFTSRACPASASSRWSTPSARWASTTSCRSTARGSRPCWRSTATSQRSWS